MVATRKCRVQTYLTQDQISSLRALSDQRRVSVAELIRDGVDHVLRESVPPEEYPLWDIIGIVDSAPSDLAEKHDEYLVKYMSEESGQLGML
jgi:hypothetical protein